MRLIELEKETCKNVDVVSKVLGDGGGELNSLTL